MDQDDIILNLSLKPSNIIQFECEEIVFRAGSFEISTASIPVIEQAEELIFVLDGKKFKFKKIKEVKQQ